MERVGYNRRASIRGRPEDQTARTWVGAEASKTYVHGVEKPAAKHNRVYDPTMVTQPVTVEVQRVSGAQVELPSYATPGSAGLDLQASLGEAVVIEPGQRRLIPTGLRLALPAGYEGQVRPRSGLALRHGISVVNSPGTIDSDFRGEVGIVLINHGQEPLAITPGMRIAQLVVARVEQVNLRWVETLPATTRGEGGYGSTGL